MFGQIATFMESLHLTYEDVFERIPYRNLVLMSRDKLHVVFGKKKEVRKVSGKEMAQRRRRNRR
ncbi:MAG: hypothetical protein J6M59_10670 [Bacteroidaceae bacterium]|nr:hypothetical protein [Bacteroidaceae bacterium]